MCAPDKASLLASKPLDSAMSIIEAHNRMYGPEPRTFDDEDEDDEEYRFEDEDEYQYEYEEDIEQVEPGVGDMAASPDSSSWEMTHDELANAMLQVNGDYLNRETQLIDDVEDGDEDDEGRAPVDYTMEQWSDFFMQLGNPIDAEAAMLEDNLESHLQESRALAEEQENPDDDEAQEQVDFATEQASGSRRSHSPLDSDSDMDYMMRQNGLFMAHRAGLIGVWREDIESNRPGFSERVMNLLVGATQYVRQRVAGLLGFLIVRGGSQSFVSVPWRFGWNGCGTGP